MKQKLELMECSADFADDTVWDDTEEHIVQTEGQAVAALLAAGGAEVSAPTDHLEHGWELNLRWRGGRFWVQVSQLDGRAIISTKDRSFGMLTWLLGRPSLYAGFREMLHQQLSADRRFRQIRWQPWLPKQGAPGALSPTSAYPGPEQN